MNKNEVLDFIHRRFPIDNNWLSGNCFFFSTILKSRFKEGIIFYDVIDGHFVTQIDNVKYDWSGIVDDKGNHIYIEWEKFDKYDSLWKKRIERDCIH